jgi:hypothetical protein
VFWYSITSLIQAKLIGSRSAGLAIREAIGQLYEYRHFIGPENAMLCVLLDGEPPKCFITYVEEIIDFNIMWRRVGSFAAGPKTLTTLFMFHSKKLL